MTCDLIIMIVYTVFTRGDRRGDRSRDRSTRRSPHIQQGSRHVTNLLLSLFWRNF